MIIILISDEPVFTRAFLSYANYINAGFEFITEPDSDDVSPSGVLIDGEGLTQARLKRALKMYNHLPIFLIHSNLKKLKHQNIVGYFDVATSKKEIIYLMNVFYGDTLNRPEHQDFAFKGFESAVLDRLATGQSNKDIARYLNAPLSRVKYAVTRIFKKLGVRNRTQVALIMHKTNL